MTGAVTALAELQDAAEAAPNTRVVAELRHGERLGVTRKVYRKFGRISRPYSGLEEFAWVYEVYTPQLADYDSEWPHIREAARGWRSLPLGHPGEVEARRLLTGELWAEVVASRPKVSPLNILRGRGAA